VGARHPLGQYQLSPQESVEEVGTRENAAVVFSPAFTRLQQDKEDLGERETLFVQ